MFEYDAVTFNWVTHVSCCLIILHGRWGYILLQEFDDSLVHHDQLMCLNWNCMCHMIKMLRLVKTYAVVPIGSCSFYLVNMHHPSCYGSLCMIDQDLYGYNLMILLYTWWLCMLFALNLIYLDDAMLSTNEVMNTRGLLVSDWICCCCLWICCCCLLEMVLFV